MPDFPHDVDEEVAAMFVAWDFATRTAGERQGQLPHLLDLYEIAFRRVTGLLDEWEEDDEDDEDEEESEDEESEEEDDDASSTAHDTMVGSLRPVTDDEETEE